MRACSHVCVVLELRYQLSSGVRLEDRPDGSSLWKMEDAETVRRQLEQKERQQLQQTADKVGDVARALNAQRRC